VPIRELPGSLNRDRPPVIRAACGQTKRVAAATRGMNSNRSFRIRYRASVVLAAVFLATLTLPVAAESARSMSTLVRELGVASSARQLLFVDVAVAELSAAYRAVTRTHAGDRSWVAGTKAFMSQFEAALALARSGARVRLVREAGSVRVVVGAGPARQFMIAAPTARGGADLERALAQHFCRRDGCGGPVTQPKAASAVLIASSKAERAGSTTSGHGAIVAELPSGDDGLRCGSTNAPHNKLQASACAALLGELRAFVRVLHGAARRGIAIEWPRIERASAAGSLVVNAAGDRVKIATPALAQAPEVGAAMVPWLRDRLAGKVRVLAVVPPSRLVYAAR
jgi:hypothetical protein